MEKETEFQKYLYAAKKELSTWLEEKLSKISSDYWNEIVIPCLSYQQNMMIKERGTTNLKNLDLACLLRIFDKNWYLLKDKNILPVQLRSYLKELQIIRNKYAHQSEDFETQDLSRDADTLGRFLKGINASPELIERVSATRSSLPVASKPEIVVLPKNAVVENKSENGVIQKGSLICLKSAPDKQGVVMEIRPDEYTVFVDGVIQTLFPEQIELVKKEKPSFVSLEIIKNYLSSFVLRQPELTSLYSLNAARIDVIPYQFKPVMKIINSEQPRLLIADSVGIGKTIEAGLILRELQIRNDIQSVLIICPKPLVTERKWEEELKRFDEDFISLDSASLNYCIKEYDKEGEWPERYKKAIFPYSLCDEKLLENLNKLKPFPKFDLVIADEAHHLRNPTTNRHRIIDLFCNAAEAVVFLSATPIQLGNEDLYELLKLLRPDLVTDKEVFKMLHEPNKFVSSALQNLKSGNFQDALSDLEKISSTNANAIIVKNPVYAEVMDKLKKTNLTLEEKADLFEKISQLHTFSSLINRTLRKDIASDFCIRHPETVSTRFTEKEEKVFSKLLSLKAQILQRTHGTNNVAFMMSTLERQASSCLHALAPQIDGILTNSLTYFDTDDEDFESLDAFGVLEEFKEEITQLKKEAENLPPEDPKFDEFLKIIKQKQSLENKKVIVFSTFRHTLFYLLEKLKAANIRVDLIYGDVADDERRKIRERFEKENDDADALDVLLFSEVGCEGLDYQFCDTMINYDLPWNPMKIEQRIGRIDRFGQKSEAVAIYNMIVEDTIDARIYNRCLNRINIFKESIGDCDEILGEIHKEIKAVCENISLSDKEKEEKLSKIAENKCKRMLDQKKMEKEQEKLFSLPQALSNAETFENYWTSPIAIEQLVLAYLKSKTGETDAILGVGEKRTLRLSKEVKNSLLKDYQVLPKKKGKIYKNWEDYLKSADQFCQITFDTAFACKTPKVQFIMPLHPLVMQAANHFKTDMPIETALQINDPSVPAGEYYFRVYAWEYKSDKPKLELKPVCEQKNVQDNILNYLETGASLKQIDLPQGIFETLNKLNRDLWQNEQQRYKAEVKKRIDFKIQSLETSLAARINVIENRVEQLWKLRTGWIEKITSQTEEKRKHLIETAEKADIITTPILSGIVKNVLEQRN